MDGMVDVFADDGTGRLVSFWVVSNAQCGAYAPEYGRLYIGSSDGQYVYVVRDTTVGIEERVADGRGAWPSLRAAPNPFCEVVQVETSGERGKLPLYVYSKIGALVRVLEPSESGPGADRYVWDGRDAQGRVVPNGVYVAAVGRGSRDRIGIVKAR
jgi:hypothetical protein